MDPKSYTVLFLIISSAVAACFFIAPFVSPYGSFTNLDGTPGVMDHWDIWSEKDPFTCIVYSIGDVSCHQKEVRTFILNGSEMPVCVRDTGLLLGFVMGCSFLLSAMGQVFTEKHGKQFIIISILLIVIDWIIQFCLELNVPFTRLMTGMLAGVGFAMLIHLWMRKIYYVESERQGREP